MAKENILVIEDEEDIREVVLYNLTKEGYQVSSLACGEAALKTTKTQLPHLILLDIMLPGIDGLAVCQLIKADTQTCHIPIIMLTAKGDETDIVTGLELGADDYITKPFSPKILIARVRAVLRKNSHQTTTENTPTQIHELFIHPGRHEVIIENQPIALTLSEFRILYFMSNHPGWVYTRYQIVEAIRGEDYSVTDRAVDVQIVGLRKKLGKYGKYIETVRGVGYRFKE